MEFLKEFLGFNGPYLRSAEGYMSWQHLTFVSVLMVIMTACAITLGLKNKNKDDITKNRVLIWAAILIDAFEIFKIVIMCWRGNDPMGWITELPLFLCSIQLITIPLAAFSKGRVKEAALDFVTIFGLLGAVLGTYLAGNNYSVYPVLSMDNVVSGITHCISGFSALYIMITGMMKLRTKNIPITLAILAFFGISAYTANVLIPYNYMFLMRGDGTPYDILFNLLNGNKVLYPISVMALFVIYIAIFYGVYYLILKKQTKTEK